MPWARVDDGWWCHPKVMSLSLTARGLWVSVLSWSCAQRRDEVPASLLAMIGATPDDAAELVAAGLWDPTDGGWEIHDWAEYQDMSTSEKRAAAGAKGGRRSGEARRSKPKQTPPVTSGNGEASGSTGEANAEAGPSLPIPALPVPSNEITRTSLRTTSNPAPTPPSDAEIAQAVNKAVGILARTRAANGNNPPALAAHIGATLPEHERVELRELIAAGATPDAAALAMADPFRDVQAAPEPRHPLRVVRNDCDDCHGTGMVLRDDNTATRCECNPDPIASAQ